MSSHQRRMEMPMGERPAAKVVRRSRTNAEQTSSRSLRADDDQPTRPDEPSSTPEVLGNIVERTPRKKRPVRPRPMVQRTGFPTLNKPVGTFVSQPKKHPSQKTTQSAPSAANESETLESLRKACRKDADSMLENMSATEIQDSILELQGQLDPSAIAFLKQRSSKPQNPSTQPVSNTTSHTVSEPASQEESMDLVEKERMAERLSAVQSLEQLDRLYHSEVNISKAPESQITSENQFDIACELLRSTSHKQTLWASRTVYQTLQKIVSESPSKYCLYPLYQRREAQPWPFPNLLPVSLRCLLDAPSSNVLQTTYVWQSLYFLLRLRACPDHVVSFDLESLGHQLEFMDDAVPNPPLRSCYQGVSSQSVAVEEGSVYSTSSSSTSAQGDGRAFLRDPMWTMLSKMRILPRVAQLLRTTVQIPSSGDSASILSREALTAICGILAMIGQRSPGAATAIVQHPTILEDLWELMFVRRDGSSWFDPSLAIKALILISTLARQSRDTASCLCERVSDSSLLIQILAQGRAQTVDKYQMQRFAIVIWRILLRYGLGITFLPSMLSVAAPFLTLRVKDGGSSTDPEFSLAPEFYSAFSEILYCIRVLASPISTKEAKKENNLSLSSDDQSILVSATDWLSSTKNRALLHLKSFAGRPVELYSRSTCASIFLYMNAYFLTANEEFGSSGECKTEDPTNLEEEDWAIVLLEMMAASESKNMFLDTLREALMPARATAQSNNGQAGWGTLVFVKAMLDLTTTLLRRSPADIKAGTRQRRIDCLADAVGGMIAQSAEFAERYTPKSDVSMLSQRSGYNRLLCSVAIFLNETKSRARNDQRVLQSVALALIGRLELGDERTAAIIFGWDEIFEASPGASPSPLQSILTRELYGESGSQSQLDHSFRLHHGFGITSEGTGPFALNSLLSETATGNQEMNSGDQFLPIGSNWLWKMLAGTTSEAATPDNDDQDVRAVLMSVLDLISKLESESDIFSYASAVPTGEKLFYLTNLCLSSEALLGDRRISETSLSLYDRYADCVRPEDMRLYCEECRRFFPSKPAAKQGSSANLDESASSNAMKSFLDLRTPTETHQSLEAFLNDLCDTYLDYGSQYPFFTKCIRLFLCPGLPTRVRCHALGRLRGVIHLLSLPDHRDLAPLLHILLPGGLPHKDMSERDPPEVIDTALALYSQDVMLRSEDTVVLAWTIALFCRSFAISLTANSSSGLMAARNRLLQLNTSMVGRLVQSTADFLKTEGSREALIKIVVSPESPVCQVPGLGFVDDNDNEKWDMLVQHLKNTKGNKYR